MANDAITSSKVKDSEKLSTAGAEASNASALRRSGRETPNKTSPQSSRKSDRLEKDSPTPPVKRKSERELEKDSPTPVKRKFERVEKQSTPNVLRRSERGKKQSSSSSSGSKKSKKSLDLSVAKKNFKKEKSVKQLTLETKKNSNIEEEVMESAPKGKDKMDARAYKAIFNQKGNKVGIGLPSKVVVKVKESGEKKVQNFREVSAGKDLEKASEESNCTISKQLNQTLEINPGQDSSCSSQNICSLGARQSEAGGTVENSEDGDSPLLLASKTLPEEKLVVDDETTKSNLNSKLEGNGADATGKCMNKNSPEDIRLRGDPNICLTCKLGGILLCCDGKGCKRMYHHSCLVPPFKDIPFGVWYCSACVKKQIKLGARSVSGGIESIWKVEISEENGLQKKRFFVKYKGLAHVYNCWVSESYLLEDPLLLAKFNRKNQVPSWKKEWTEPHRMLQKRLFGSPKVLDVHKGQVDDVFDCHYQWLVKWRGLDYENATWELENASFMKLPEAQNLIRDYENRLGRAKKRTHTEIEIEKRSVKPVQLTVGGSSEIDNNHLDFCNNLREQWHKGKNVVIMDDLERIMKVITFIASLSSDGCWPFLIITSSDASLWDEEFSRLAPSIAAVVYCGNQSLRRRIRAVEFSLEGGGVMFDVLITSPETVVEDLDILRSIKWEAMIVDECQRPRIFTQFEQFKNLSTKMRLLLVNGQLKDGIIEHLLLLLDCQSDRDSDGLITNSDHRIRDLKEKLSKYIIDGSKPDTSRFIEYWVPVPISNPQLEQYCATLLSNSLPLCSSSNSKNDPVGAFRDIIIFNRKCCDHPYITDSLLGNHLTKHLEVTDFLDVGIKASGKLQVLDAMLLELRNRGLRVLILFQSSGGSGKDNLGDILDDFVRQRFGNESYERLDGLVSPGRKQTALCRFNNEKSRFVFLLETRACLPSIKLSSVDTVIIFSSDWNPANDIRSLQRITLDTQSQQLKIFRLYSSFTVEENALILAKQSKPLDSNLQNISRATRHNLLMWGVSYLFCKLDEFHSCCTLVTGGSKSLETTSHEDIIQDFLTRLTQNAKDCISRTSSIILKAKQNQGNYCTDFPLPCEQKIQVSDADLPHIFWKKLLRREQPQWKYTSGLSQWNRKRVQHRDEILERAEGECEGVAKKRKKVANNNFDEISIRSAATENEGGLATGPQCVHPELNSRSTTHLIASNTKDISNLPSVAHDKSELRAVDIAKFGERIDARDSQKSLHTVLQPEIAKLCEVLGLPEDVKAMAQSFLEYVMNTHYVIKEPATILQAFHISLCWTAASMLKYKIDHTESLELAKQHLDFGCRKEEADIVYSMLKCLKKFFLYLRKKNSTPAYSPCSLQQNKDKFEDMALGHESIDDAVLSQLGEHAFSRSIQAIEKKYKKKMTKLLQKQQEETEQSKRTYESEKKQLENKKKTEAAVIRLHSINSMRADKLRQLDIEYKKKFEDLNCQMEMQLKKLQEMHNAAKEKVEKGKESWLQAVKSWAKKDSITKSENACTLSSHLKKQNQELIENLQGKVIQVEVSETVSTSNNVEVVTTGALSTGKQNLDGVKSYMTDREVSLGEQDREVAEAIIVNKFVDSSDKTAGITQANEDIPSGTPEISGGVEVEKRDSEDPSTAPKASDQLDKKSQSLDKSDGAVVEDTNVVNEIPDISERTTVVTQEYENSPSGIREIAVEVEGDKTREQQDVDAPSAMPETAELVKGKESSDKQDGDIQAIKKVDNKKSQSLDKSGVELLSGVTGTAPDEVAEDTTAGGEISGVRVTGPTLSARLLQEDEVILSQNMEVDLSLVQGDTSGKEIGDVSAVNVEGNHPQVSSLAHQEQCVEQITSTRLLDGVPSSVESLNPLEQSEPLVHEDGVALDRANTDTPTVDHGLQMPSTGSALSPNAMDLPSAGEYEHPSSREGNINIESSTQMAGDQGEQSSQAVETHLGGSGVHVSDTRTVPILIGARNSSTQTGSAPVRIPPFSVPHDPLQNELERIRTETEQIISIHENTKQQLKSDCEKEIEEIRRKYETKFQEMESDFLSRKKDLDENNCKVHMNKILARAFRSKCMDIKGSSAPGLLQQGDVPSGVLQHLIHLSSLAANVRRNLSGPSSTGGPQVANPITHSAAAAAPRPVRQTSAAPTLLPVRQTSALVSCPLQQSVSGAAPTTRQSSAAVSGPSSAACGLVQPLSSSSSPAGSLTRPWLIINSITPPAANAQKSSEVRAPAPHIQPFRSVASPIPTNSSSPMLDQHHVSSHPATKPSQPAAAQQSPPGIFAPLSSSAVHDLERMDEDNTERNPNPPSSCRADPPPPALSPPTNQIVCVLDDD